MDFGLSFVRIHFQIIKVDFRERVSKETWRALTIWDRVNPLDGALVALKLTHTPFSVSSVLGLLALLGVSVETAVILVSYINKLRNEGMDIRTATREASLLRLRPIMMTALVACLGLLPAALSILTTTFKEGSDRTTALGVWGAVAGLASAVGVFLGGVLTEGPGWRWVLFVNPPIALLLLGAIFWLIVSAISFVSRSWTWRRRLNTSTRRGILLRPITLLLGM